MLPWLPHKTTLFLQLLKRLFSTRLVVANCYKKSQWTRRMVCKKKERQRLVLDGLRLSLLEWCCRIHSYAFTRNLGVAPLMLWTPLILRRYLTIVCFWLWCCPACSFWLQLQVVASRCSTFAPERLIGNFCWDVEFSVGLLVYRVLYSFILSP